MTAPAANLAGSVTLASTAADANSGVASVQYEYRTSRAGTWTTACTGATTPFSCAFNTTSVADGLYDFRATATDNAGRATTSAAVTARRIDNTNPVTSTLAAVGTNLAGNVNFTGTAADNGGGSGVGSWKVQTSPTGANTWTDLCTDTTTPFGACTGNVDGFADGVYDFRAVVTDHAGNTLASTAQTGKRVDTDGPVTSVASPVNNARVSGNVTMTANATDPAGVTNVDFQVLLGGNWFTFCTDNTPQYSCTGDSTQVADGTYQTRVIATDSLGHQTISATITLIIDNTHPTAASVNAANGGTAGAHRLRRHAHLHVVRADGARVDPDRLERRRAADPHPRERRRRRRHARPLRLDRHDQAERHLGGAGAAPERQLGQQHRLAQRLDDDEPATASW